jgi:hypothetical protein
MISKFTFSTGFVLVYTLFLMPLLVWKINAGVASHYRHVDISDVPMEQFLVGWVDCWFVVSAPVTGILVYSLLLG